MGTTVLPGTTNLRVIDQRYIVLRDVRYLIGIRLIDRYVMDYCEGPHNERYTCVRLT